MQGRVAAIEVVEAGILLFLLIGSLFPLLLIQSADQLQPHLDTPGDLLEESRIAHPLLSQQRHPRLLAFLPFGLSRSKDAQRSIPCSPGRRLDGVDSGQLLGLDRVKISQRRGQPLVADRTQVGADRGLVHTQLHGNLRLGGTAQVLPDDDLSSLLDLHQSGFRTRHIRDSIAYIRLNTWRQNATGRGLLPDLPLAR